ncbi:MAG: HAMP domain-containing histidine kinase [Nitrospirae bacterium]|nr:HAMP domain-containing histidine kinase [Nitrospirota bacterium]
MNLPNIYKLIGESFRYKILTFTIAVMAIISVVYTYESVKTEKNIMRAELIARAEEVISLMARASELAVLSENGEYLRKSLNSITSIKDVTAAVLFDKNWRPLIRTKGHIPLKSGNISVNQPVTFTDEPEAMNFYAPIFTIIVPEETLLNDSAPITLVNTKQKLIGWVAITFSKLPIIQAQKQNLYHRITMAIVFTSMGSVLIYILITLLTKPLKLVTEAVIDFHNGRFQEIGVNSMDEIGTLANEFNLMATAIKLRTEELNQINVSLENRVQEEIRKRRQQEQLIIQQSKFIAMGEMIIAIAHHWRQPLNAIGVMVQEIKDAYNYNELSEEFFRTITRDVMEQLRFMSRTIDNFSNYFKPSTEKTQFDVLDSVHEAVSLLSAQMIENGIELCFEPSIDENLRTLGYKNEFIQVLLNLIINARDAVMDAVDKGVLQKGEGQISLSCLKKENTIFIKIKDNAMGIRQELESKIFDPFFTTKGLSKATGLGLYMSKTIIEHNMDGKIYAENLPKGAVFTIELQSV